MKIRPKEFRHQLLAPQQELTRIDGQPGGRYYLLGNSPDRFYSVTNILSTMIKSKELEAWKKARDKEAAEGKGESAAEIAKKASDRGTALHSFCEQYLLNKDVTELLTEEERKSHIMFSNNKNFEIFKRVKEVLDRDIDDILGIEIPLFSRVLKVAGTPDVIAYYKKKPAIIDFKTIRASYKITDKRVLKYFLQGVFYSIMVKELYGIEIRKVVLIFGTEFDELATVLDLKIEDRDIERVIRLTEGFTRQLNDGLQGLDQDLQTLID